MKLTEKAKNEIVNLYETGEYPQAHLAFIHDVSRRTIGRVLRAAGCTAPQNVVSEGEMQMVHLLRKYSMSSRILRVLLKIAYPEVK